MKASLLPEWKKLPAVRAVAEVVALHYGLTLEQLVTFDRHEQLVWPRHLACYLSNKLLGASQTTISSVMKRERSSVSYAVLSFQDRIDVSQWARDEMGRIMPEITARLRKETA
jgi:chromosomal replication initiation ATPase DnaA